MRGPWLFFLLFAACAATPEGPIVIPTVAYPFDRDTLVRADVQECASTISDLSPGRIERAAFLRLNASGAFDCRVWPAPFAVERADWAGPPPNGTVAVIHTHPRDLPDPSAQDRSEAARLSVPVIVVTAQQITMAMPAGGATLHAERMNGGGFSVAYTARDEAARTHHPHTR